MLIAEADGIGSGYAYPEIHNRPETPFHESQDDMVFLHYISMRPGERRRGIDNALGGAVRPVASDIGIR